MRYILSIDCGTQSLRGMIFDSQGNMLAKEKIEYDSPYYSSSPGFAEKNPEDYYQALCSATKKLVENKPDLCRDISGVVLTVQRDTCVLTDEMGNPLRDAILWLDQREADCSLKDHFSLVEIAGYTAVGMRDVSQQVMRKSKAYWVKQHEPDIWAKTHKFLLLSGYLYFRLTGNFKDSISNCIGHIPFQSKIFGYPSNPGHISYRQFGVEKEKLAELVSVGDNIGELTKIAAENTGLSEGLPIIAGASDKGCETLSCGCVSENGACLSFGTTATVQITTKKYIEPLRFIPPYPAAMKGYYNPEYEIYRGYWMVSWFKKELAVFEEMKAKERGISTEDLLDEKLAQIPPGSDGLMLQPYWTPGIKMKDAKGCMIGFTDIHTKYHIYKAIIEGINYELIKGIRRFEQCTGVKIDKIYVTGGGSQCDEICRITANMTGCSVYRTHTYETSGLGAAMIGFTAAGDYKSLAEASKGMIRHTDIFKPEEQQTKLYNELYRIVYSKIYKVLKPLYHGLNQIYSHYNY